MFHFFDLGKTSVIRQAAELWIDFPALEPSVPGGKVPLMVCCARSNVAALNIAHALCKSSSVKGRFRCVTKGPSEGFIISGGKCGLPGDTPIHVFNNNYYSVIE